MEFDQQIARERQNSAPKKKKKKIRNIETQSFGQFGNLF